MRPIYIDIFKAIGDGRWHKKSEFCRPYSSDDRRLREMHENGWIQYEERPIKEGIKVLYTEYRIIYISDTWWQAVKKEGLFKPVEHGQLSFV